MNSNHTVDNINMLLHYLGPSLYEIKCSNEHVHLIASIADIYRSFNDKKDGITFEQIWKFNEKIDFVLKKLNSYATRKTHAFSIMFLYLLIHVLLNKNKKYFQRNKLFFF